MQESHNDKQDKTESSLENRVIELQDEIKLLKTEVCFNNYIYKRKTVSLLIIKYILVLD
jgi:cell division protein FtsB